MARKKTGSHRTAGGLSASAAYRMLNMILESAKIRTDIVDRNFNVVFADSFTREELGEAGGKFCYEYFRGKDKPCPGCVIREAARKGTAQSTEIYNEQEKKWKKIIAIPFKDNDGRELFSEIKIDISDYVRSRDIFESLSRGYEEREERYKALFNNAKIAWFVAEASTGIIADVNHEAEKLSGRNRQELIGMDRLKLHPPEDEKFYKEQFKSHIMQGNVLAAEAVVCRKDGKRVPVEISAVLSDSGGRKYIQGLFVDISKRKKAEEELLSYQAGLEETVRERTADLKAVNEHLAAQSLELEKARLAAEHASRLKSEFIASMSHELGTPLNAINGFSMVLMNGKYGDLNKKQLEYMKIIRESVNLLVSLVDEALDLSKIEAGKFELNLCEFELDSLLERCLSLVKEKALDRGIKLSIEAVAGLLVKADERKIMQVVLNLLSNAEKFTPDGGKLGVKSELSGKEAVVSVWDSGPEIKEGDRERIFEKYVRLKDPGAREAGGTGLGLVIAKRMVELHGGRMWVENGGKEKRTVFCFSLPV